MSGGQPPIEGPGSSRPAGGNHVALSDGGEGRRQAAGGRRDTPPRGLPSLRAGDPLLLLILAAPIGLAASRLLLPAAGAGLAVRLVTAFVCVLVLPGALTLRLLGAPQGWPLQVAGAVAWSLAHVFAAQAVAFALGGQIGTTLAVVVLVAGVELFLVLRRRSPAVPGAPRDVVGVCLVLGLGLAVAAAVWWVATPVTGDALEHLARARKLVALDAYGGVGITELFRDAPQHPGYAFPLWHSALALWSVLAEVDPALVIRFGAVALAPTALAVAYAAGWALFGSRAPALALSLLQLAWWGLPAGGIGAFAIITGPATASVLVLLPAMWALAFAYVAAGRVRLLWSIGAAGLCLAVTHPNYVVYALVPLAGTLLARALVAGAGHDDVRRLFLACAVVSVPTAGYFLYLLPLIAASPSVAPEAPDLARQMSLYGLQLEAVGSRFRMAPEAISRMGPVSVAGLLAIPVAALAPHRRWSAFVLGGGVLVLAILLSPRLFTLLGHYASYSQARRLAVFVPVSFAVAGLCALLSRARWAGAALAVVAGALLLARFPGDYTYRMTQGGGSALAPWVGLLGGSVALAVRASIARRAPGIRAGPPAWILACAVAFVAPVAVAGIGNLQRAGADRLALTPGLVRSVSEQAPVGDVAFSDDATAYRLAAFTPVYVNSGVTGHVWDRPEERSADARRFFHPDTTAHQRSALLAKYEARWVVARHAHLEDTGLDRAVLDRALEPVYTDGAYTLYRPPDTRSRRDQGAARPQGRARALSSRATAPRRASARDPRVAGTAGEGGHPPVGARRG